MKAGIAATATLAAAPAAFAQERKTKLGLDNFAVREMKWKAEALIDYAAQLKTDSLFITDLNAFENFEDSYLTGLRKKAADKGLDIQLGTWSICPTSTRFDKKWGTAEEHLALGIRVAKALGTLPFLTEDLGIITPEVRALRDAVHLPGTRVLQFAFDLDPENPHLPENHVHNTVVYTGTHDHPTTRGWYEDLPDAARRSLWRAARRPEGTTTDAVAALLELAWSSTAALAIAPLQDVLRLEASARMNQPGSAKGNWRWRVTEHQLSASAFESLRELTRASSRSAGIETALAGRRR